MPRTPSRWIGWRATERLPFALSRHYLNLFRFPNLGHSGEPFSSRSRPRTTPSGEPVSILALHLPDPPSQARGPQVARSR